MRIFVTGATGYIGGSVAVHLRDAGHAILALARSEEKDRTLRGLGFETLPGTLDDDDALRRGATATDATINAADADHLQAVESLVAALAGSGKTLIHTSGSSIAGDDAKGAFASPRIVADDAPFEAQSHRESRIRIDRFVRSAGISQGLRAAVVCPTMVYGPGLGPQRDSDQVPKITARSLVRGAGVHIGAGANIWSNVFIEDLCDLYALVLQKAPSGSFLFAENGEATLKEVAQAVSRSLGFEGRTESWDLAEATAELGAWPRIALGTNSRVRGANARAIGWSPTGPSLAVAVGEQGRA